METVKIVFDIDTTDVKTSTDELKALNKATETEIETLKRLEAESNASKVAFSQLSKEIKSANNELLNAKKTFGDTSKEAQSAQKNVDALTDKMAELKNTVKPLDEAFVSLRTQVKQAKEEAQKAAEKYGEFSQEANNARQKAGLLADQMGDLNRQVGLLNPEAKAKAFSNLAQGVVGAFGVATGALQAFGVKNKEVEELAMKLQGALNIAQGIASFGQLKEAMQDVKIVLGFTTAATGTFTAAQEAQAIAAAQAAAGNVALTAAQEAEAIAAAQAAAATTGFGVALAATGIGAIVIVIGVLVGAMIALGNATESDEQKQKEFEGQLKSTNQELDNQRGLVTRLSDALAKDAQTAILRAKLRGAGEQEIADISKKAYERSRALLAQDVVNQKKAFDEASVNGKLKYEDLEVFEKRYYESAGDLRDLDYNYQLENLNSQLDLQEKSQQKRENDSSKRKQDLKEQEQEAAKLLKQRDDLRKQLQDNTLAEISDPAERIKQARQFANENYAIEEQRLKDEGANQEARDKLAADHTALVIKFNNEEANANKAKNDKILEAEKKLQTALLALQLAQETDPLKRAQIINDAKEKEIDDKLALVEKGSSDEQALLADKATAEIEAAKRVSAALIEVNKNTNNAITEEDKKAAEDRKALQEAALQSAQFIGDTLFEASTNQTNAELALLEEQKGQKLISEKDYQEKVRKLRQKQAEDQKKQAIFNATVDLARAIIAALTIAPPASAVAANFAAILGGANLAKIIATPIPKFQKGTLAVPGVNMGKDSVHAMLQPGEAVIPVSTNRAYHPTIKAIYEKKISPSEINNFVMSRTSSGGKQSITANVDTYALGRALGKNKTVEVGNANMIGKAMAQELLRGNNYRRS